MALDVTDTERGAAVVREVAERFGRVDVLVNNAGRTQVGALEESSEEELRSLFDLHFFGPAMMTRAVLPVMRKAGGGTVVQMSSVGGQVTAPGFGAYCATKFALEGLSEALAAEVAPHGIKVMIVEPGALRTRFSGDSLYQSAELPAYAETVGPTRAFITGLDGTQPGDPARAATAVVAALDGDKTPLRLPLGDDAYEAARRDGGGLDGHAAAEHALASLSSPA